MFAIVTDGEERQDADDDEDHEALDAGDDARAGDVQDGHRHEQGDGEDLHPGGVVAGERRAGVAPEREGDHRRDDAVRDVGQPGDDRRDVAVAEALVDVLEQAAGGRELGTELANE